MNDHAHPTRPDDADASVRTYSVPEISCDHCKTAIESSVAEVDGVTDVNVDVTSKTVAVSGGADPDIVAAIVEAGYDVA